MKQVISVAMALAMMVGVVVAENEERNEYWKQGESNQEQPGADKPVQELHNEQAAADSLAHAQELYTQQGLRVASFSGFPEFPASLTAFMPSDVYANKWSEFAVNTLHFVHQFPMGENNKFLPVFEAIYQFLSDSIPGCYMDKDAAMKYAFVQSYAEFLCGKDHTGYGSSKSDMAIFFKAKEAAMGENSIKARLENFLNSSSIESNMLALMLYQNDFCGVTKNELGRFAIDL